MAYGKSIELFLVNGSADSLITAELSNWNGKAIKIPRIEVASCDRQDFKQAGVYFLFCKNDEDEDSFYSRVYNCSFSYFGLNISSSIGGYYGYDDETKT